MTIEQTVEIPANRREKTFIESLGSFCGCLETSSVFEGNPVEIQKQIRTEWDRSWEKNV
jgi:hypothetical protein